MDSINEATPPAGIAWQPVADPGTLGFDAAALADATAFAEAHETDSPRDIGESLRQGMFEPPPHNEILGPTGVRGGPQGVIVRRGRIAAQWGDPDRAEQTFSVAKSYLAVLAGIAIGDGLIRDVDDAVAEYALDDGFEDAHNGAITWRHLLQQTSEWQGTLWSKPDTIDHNRQIGAGADNSRKGQPRPLQTPGSFWEYNDVRVNRLSRSLMQVFRRPLPEVLGERLMVPLGASDGWSWAGYDNAWEEIDGRRIQGVPGGTHWGGGLYIGARDQARLGLLMLNNGRWGGRQLIDAGWIAAMAAPCPINDEYGFLWWRNPGWRVWPAASDAATAAIGAGGNIVLVEPSRDLVVVARWLDNAVTADFIGRVIAAIVD
jgi:CubicO group peptidase (beta-lactamase class C family)